jgi:hypothetical protein
MWDTVTNYIKGLMMNILPDWAINLISDDDEGSDDQEARQTAMADEQAVNLPFDRDTAVDRSTTQQSWNSNIDQNVEINISTNDPERAGAAVQDALQRQMEDTRTMSNRGGM